MQKDCFVGSNAIGIDVIGPNEQAVFAWCRKRGTFPCGEDLPGGHITCLGAVGPDVRKRDGLMESDQYGIGLSRRVGEGCSSGNGISIGVISAVRGLIRYEQTANTALSACGKKQQNGGTQYCFILNTGMVFLS